jgi:hypothetical protein
MYNDPVLESFLKNFEEVQENAGTVPKKHEISDEPVKRRT